MDEEALSKRSLKDPRKIQFIFRADRIANKRASGRKQDIADLEELTSREKR
jgi:hypothetical protein